MKSRTFINCDLQYFNLELLRASLNFSFDVIMVDPPWPIKGQRNDRQMFSNNSFKHAYNIMHKSDIMNLRVECLSDAGFCFLWVLNSILDTGYACLKKWGYEVIDQIVWVKTKGGKTMAGPGYYFHHGSEICLVGLKRKEGKAIHYNPRQASNVIHAEVRKSS